VVKALLDLGALPINPQHDPPVVATDILESVNAPGASELRRILQVCTESPHFVQRVSSVTVERRPWGLTQAHEARQRQAFIISPPSAEPLVYADTTPSGSEEQQRRVPSPQKLHVYVQGTLV
jgi:hypothetical protein